ncbi:MAG TPA: TadE family protein [Candidatus Sulfotelmatobacter sp.]|nr:TadE family protein [Candidatus Sulfotelmatobacter sp.]
MMLTARLTLRRLTAETRGTEIAEAAAVLPLMFMMILGIFWFGQAFSMYGTITRAAQDGARAGAAPYCTTCTTTTPSPGQNAFNAVQSAMVVAKLDPTKARYPLPLPALNSCTGAGPVACDSASSNVCVQSSVLLSNTVGGATAVCGMSVSFQYPFQFKLPFTSLNNQQVWLTTAARVRMENQ